MPRLLAALMIVSVSSSVLGEQRRLPFPDESAGIDGIARTIVAAFDRFDIVALGEEHERTQDSDLRIAVVRHPDFAKKVRFIVVEFATTAEQATLDRYIRGEDVSRAQLERVRPTQPGSLTSKNPIYEEFFAAIREVNLRLPADARIRVFGGEDNRNRDTAALSILKEQVLPKRGKALVIYGAGHFYRAMPPDLVSDTSEGIGLVRMLDREYPGRTFAVIPLGPFDLPPGLSTGPAPDYRKFDRALKTQVRPVLVSLQRPPFRDFTAEEFLGNTLLTCNGPGGCRSAFKGSALTLSQMADAGVYSGRGRQ